MTILSFLGTSCPDYSKDQSDARYDDKTDLIKAGAYKNGTHALLDNHRENLILIGTQTAIDKQTRCLGVLPTTETIEEAGSDNDLTDVFAKTLETILKQHHDEEIVLDVTHGLRHQPIMAAFASFIARYGESRKIRLLFAREIEQFKHYEYIWLDGYFDAALISAALTSFVQTYTVPSVLEHHPLLDSLRAFSHDLFANNLTQMREDSLPNTLSSLELESSEHLRELKRQTKEELDEFGSCFLEKEKHTLYLRLSRLVFTKGYLLISLTYLREAIPLYFHQKLDQLAMLAKKADANPKKMYDLLQAIDKFIQGNIDDKVREWIIDPENNYQTNRTHLKEIGELLDEVSELRNSAAHVGFHKDNNAERLGAHLQKVEDLLIEQDVGAQLKNYFDHDSYEKLVLALKKEAGISEGISPKNIANIAQTLLEQPEKIDPCHIKTSNKEKYQKWLRQEQEGVKKLRPLLEKFAKSPSLHLLLNHPLTPEQEQAAKTELRVTQINIPSEKLKPLWAAIPPEPESLDDTLLPFKQWLGEKATKGDYLLIAGDFGATFKLVEFARSQGLIPIYATTCRESQEQQNPDGSITKTNTFRHVRFRRY